jgi:hypothetical protein
MTSQSDSSTGSAGERPAPLRRGDSTPRRVLEDVLNQTAALYALELGSDPSDLEALAEVARRLRGVEFELQPVLVELVRATLRRQLKSVWHSEQQFTEVADRVANTLYENPVTHARLQALWIRLSAVE